MDSGKENIFDAFVQASQTEQFEQLKNYFDRSGFSGFNSFLHTFKEKIRHCREEELEELRKLVQKARQIFPNPQKYSPSWDGIWNTLERILHLKEEVFRKVGKNDRNGEWQVLMDNPYTHQAIVCRPGLTFEEAAYLYAYFGLSLEKNEYIRLQKVVTALMATGRNITFSVDSQNGNVVT